MCFPLLPETKRVANELVGEQSGREWSDDGGGRKRREEKTIPLAQLSSDRWHRELIPRLSCVSPSTAPSRVSPGPPWQIWRAMWPPPRPRGGSQSRHVAFTFCAGGLAGLSLAAAAADVKAQTLFFFNFRAVFRQSGVMLVSDGYLVASTPQTCSVTDLKQPQH